MGDPVSNVSSHAMPDTPSPPVSPTPPPPSNGGKPPGDFNQGQLDANSKSEGIARAAQKPAYNALLITEGMEEDTPVNLLAKCAVWRDLSGEARGATTDKEANTGLGEDAGTILKRHVEFLRTKARLMINKHPEWKEAEVTAFKARYFIRSNIFSSRALAEQSAGTLLKNAAEDNLPSVTPQRLAQANAALANYTASKAPQSDAQSEATKLRQQRDDAFAEALRLRHDIQYAADTAWPWWDDANVAVRREFLLPAGRPFVG